MKGRKELPAGTAFLHGIAGRDELFKMHKSENAKAAIGLGSCAQPDCGPAQLRLRRRHGADRWPSPTSKKFGITYAETGMYDLLHRMDFSCRKPRPKAPKISLRIRERGVQKKLGGTQGTTQRGGTR